MLMLALTPIILLIITLFGLKLPLTKAAPITFSYTLVLTWLKWDLSPTALVGVVLKSGLLTLDVMVILFGAILFLDYLREVNLISPMQDKLSNCRKIKEFRPCCLPGYLVVFLKAFLASVHPPPSSHPLW